MTSTTWPAAAQTVVTQSPDQWVAQEQQQQQQPADEAQPAESPGGWGGSIMLGGAVSPDYDGSEDYAVGPLFSARLSYDTYYVETRGLGLRANLSPLQGIEFGPSIGLRSGRGDVDNDAVDDMRNIDDTVDAGAFVRVFTGDLMLPGDELSFQVEALTDVGGESTGTTVSFGPSYEFSATESIRLGVDLSATYASDAYANTYFGVDGRDAARSGLSRYDAGDGLKDVGVTFSATYLFNEHWAVTGIAGYTRLVGDAADSPIVEDEGSANQGLFGIGVSYGF